MIRLGNEKKPGCLGYMGDEILPSFIGIMINHYKLSLLTNQDSIESMAGFFSWLIWKFMGPSGRKNDNFFIGTTYIGHLHLPNRIPLEHNAFLEPQTTIYKWMFGETTIFYTKIWNHPIEISIYKWLFRVPGYLN